MGPPVFLRFAIEGTKAGELAGFCGAGLGGTPVGSLGTAIPGGFRAELRDDSGSEVYDDSWFAVSQLEISNKAVIWILPPVSIPPPRFFNFGIPPANRPANCGGCSIPETTALSLLP